MKIFYTKALEYFVIYAFVYIFAEQFMQRYKMKLEEILKKKMHGDIKTAGCILGIGEQNAHSALKRVGSKYHQQMVDILSRVIETREMIANENNNQLIENHHEKFQV